MIKNKLKINDSKTEFIIFRSPQCKASISGVSVGVGDSNILPSPKVRDLGVIFDECLDAHISNICRRAQFHLRNMIVFFLIFQKIKLKDCKEYKEYKTKQRVC